MATEERGPLSRAHRTLSLKIGFTVFRATRRSALMAASRIGGHPVANIGSEQPLCKVLQLVRGMPGDMPG